MKDITKTMPNKAWRCMDLWDIIHEDICRRFSSVGRDADSNTKVSEFITWRRQKVLKILPDPLEYF